MSVAFCAAASQLGAQAHPPTAPAASQVGSARQFETRAQLESQIRLAESQKRTSDAWLLRSRLERGDFQEGDRIVVVLDGTTPVSDTLQVRSGKVLQIPQMGEVQLSGVLRSELTERVRQHLSRFLTSPMVRTVPLLPISVLGRVNIPGFYYTPADAVLRDVLMRAGGPATDANFDKIVVRRAGQVIWNSKDVKVAIADGLSIDGLHMRAGDEIFVPQQRSFGMGNMLAIVSSTVALLVAVVNLSN